MPDGMMISPRSQHKHWGDAEGLSTANPAGLPTGVADVMMIKVPKPLQRSAPMITARIYEQFLLDNTTIRGGDLLLSDIDGSEREPPPMTIRCADGYAIKISGYWTKEGRAPRFLGFYTAFVLTAPGMPSGNSISAAQVDRIIQDHGGISDAQATELEMAEYVKLEVVRHADLYFARRGHDGRPEQGAPFFGPQPGIKKPAPVPTEYVDKLSTWRMIELYEKFGARLAVRTTGPVGLALGIEGDAANVPDWLNHAVINNSIEVIDACRALGWNYWDAWDRKWVLIKSIQSPFDAEIDRLCGKAARRGGLGNEFSKLWRLSLKFKNWREGIDENPGGFRWAGGRMRYRAREMQQALLSHRSNDVESLRIQLRLISQEGLAEREVRVAIERASEMLYRLSKGAG